MRPSQMPPRRPTPPPFPIGGPRPARPVVPRASIPAARRPALAGGAGRIDGEGAAAYVHDWAAHVAAGRIGGAAALPVGPPEGELGCASLAAIVAGVRR